MQLNHKRFHLGVFGGSGTGKTTYATTFFCNARARCVFIFDPEGEFAYLLKIRPATTPEEIDAGIRIGWVVFDPYKMFPGENEKALEFFADLALRASEKIHGRKFFVVDELGMFVTGASIPKPIKRLIQTGRRYGVDCIFIAQQPNTIHNNIRLQLSEVVCFQMTDKNALEFPEDFGFVPDQIRALRPYEWICRNNQGMEARCE